MAYLLLVVVVVVDLKYPNPISDLSTYLIFINYNYFSNVVLFY